MSEKEDKKKDENSDYAEKTERIYAWKSMGGLVIKLIWLMVIIIILASFGKLFLINDSQTDYHTKNTDKKSIITPIPWQEIDRSIASALKASRNTAEQSASSKLDVWVKQQMVRVDDDFLDWYFSYWNQQVRGIKALWYGGSHWLGSDKQTASERITANVQKEFSKRVLRPQIAQLELERITRETVMEYVISLRRNLQEIPEKYEISKKDWYRHLDDIAVLTNNVEGNREVAISLKALTTSTAAGTVVLAKAMTPAMKALGTKVSAKFAGKTAAKVATKTGSKVAAKAGGKLLGPVIGIGIIIWDIWDHNSTVNENKPILRKGIHDYLYEVKNTLLHDTDSSVMSVIYRLEINVLDSLL